MAAAIDARKSTDQSGISDEQRSVARQVEHARTYATRNHANKGRNRTWHFSGGGDDELANVDRWRVAASGYGGYGNGGLQPLLAGK
jgi:hypothetical protein